MIIDVNNLIAGRVATHVAKRAILGETIEIVNSENAVISGKRKDILTKYKERMARGMPKTGPFFYRRSDQFLRRLIRGMLPFSQEKGRAAFKRIKCYVGVPERFKNAQFETIETASIKKLKNVKFLKIREIVELLK